MSTKWTKRLVISALTMSVSGVGVASTQSLGDRDGSDNVRDQYGVQDHLNRGERRDGVKIEKVIYGRDYRRDNRWGRGYRHDHGRHRGWYKRKHHRGHDHGHGHGHYGRR